jgi:hypothetical protein
MTEQCFFYYPQFRKDIDGLIDAKILKHISVNCYDWQRTRTSLAEYFSWIGRNSSHVPGGFWNPVETLFTVKGTPIKRGSLSRLLCKQRNFSREQESEGFREIKEILSTYRSESEKYEDSCIEAEKWLKEWYLILQDYFEVPDRERPKITYDVLNKLVGTPFPFQTPS